MPDAFDQLNDTPQQPTTPANATTPVTPSAQPQTASQQPPSGYRDAFDQLPDDTPKAPTTNDPRKTGEIVNDVGNKVIVPKDGESFADTMKRAVAYHKSLTPAQQQAAIDKEVATMPRKTAQTLGAAATIGVVGPAMLAAPGEIAEAVPSVLTHTVEGVKAIGAWAAKNPVQAYLLYNVIKDLLPGAKKAIGIVKGMPEVE
ncbi:MAG: hypothetical protein ACLQLC_06940 [Candidatus Sulfotelmatobacter sp.]